MVAGFCSSTAARAGGSEGGRSISSHERLIAQPQREKAPGDFHRPALFPMLIERLSRVGLEMRFEEPEVHVDLA